jgi:hypothetical protein
VPRVVLAAHHRGGRTAQGPGARPVDRAPLEVVDETGRQRDVAVVGRDHGHRRQAAQQPGLDERQVQVHHPRAPHLAHRHAGQVDADGALADAGEHRRAHDPHAVPLVVGRQRRVVLARHDAHAPATGGEPLRDVAGDVGQPGDVGRVVGQDDHDVVDGLVGVGRETLLHRSPPVHLVRCVPFDPPHDRTGGRTAVDQGAVSVTLAMTWWETEA